MLLALVAALVLAACTGLLILNRSDSGGSSRPPAVLGAVVPSSAGSATTTPGMSDQQSPEGSLAEPTLGALPPAAGTSPPTRVSIPSIGVDSSLESLGLLANGELQPPTEWQQAGWYADGIVPGGTGPAVIIGHVDSVSGPAVFFRLGDLRVGDPVLVKRKDGSTLRFVVEAMRSYPKDHFPTAAVYGPTPLPELRLITCTGQFDRDAHSYLDNLVVSARLA